MRATRPQGNPPVDGEAARTAPPANDLAMPIEAGVPKAGEPISHRKVDHHSAPEPRQGQRATVLKGDRIVPKGIATPQPLVPKGFALTIRGRIRGFQAVVALAVTVMAAIAVFDLEASKYHLGRVEAAQRQRDGMLQLAVYANRYSEQIAELLLVGEPERPDFDSARAQVSRVLWDLRWITLREAAVLRSSQEQEEERVELKRVDRMKVLFDEIDRAVERVLLLDRQGRHEEAIALFRSEIENRLDAEFEQLINEALEDERQELAALEADAARLEYTLLGATLVALAVVLALTFVTGFVFARSIRRPIAALAAAAAAIERGDFAHRISYHARDELGLLAKRFDLMAEQLGRQQAILVDAQGQLEREVAERTEELAGANRKLITADRQRLQFLADVSHELRTPLTALRGEAELALRGASKPESVYREALSTVVARAADIARLVEDLLFLARSETGEIRFDWRVVDLAEVVAETMQECSVLARERRIDVVDAGAPRSRIESRADPRRLKQAVMIALDNAIKYSNPGTRVEVSTRIAPDDGAAAEVTIRDHGAGLAPEDVRSAFDRFYRGANARDRWDGGSGLGLPIARWIMEQHGGTIDLASSPGEGTVVRLRLPVSS